MKELKIYLAGKMSGLTFHQMNTWRELVTTSLQEIASSRSCEINIINPVDYYNFKSRRNQNEREVMDFDLAHVLSSDVVIVNMNGLADSDGTKIECWEARKNDIPVLGFNKTLYSAKHPWIMQTLTRTEDSHTDVINYIRDFYM